MSQAEITISVDRDYIVIGLPQRTDCISMSPDMAQLLAERGLMLCEEAENWLKAGGVGHLDKGEPMGARVRSWDGRVNVKLSRFMKTIRLPVKRMAGDKEVNPARVVFDEIRAKVVEARYGFTVDNSLKIHNVAPNVGG